MSKPVVYRNAGKSKKRHAASGKVVAGDPLASQFSPTSHLKAVENKMKVNLGDMSQKKYGNTAGFFEWIAAPKSKMKAKRLDERTKRLKRRNKMNVTGVTPKGGQVRQRVRLRPPAKKAKPLIRL